MARNKKYGFACGMIIAVMSLTSCTQNTETNIQGWTGVEQNKWYRGSQGSRLIPKAWLDALEQADSESYFFSPENVESLGYLAAPSNSQSALPIGFAVDDQDDSELGITKLRWFKNQGSTEPWVGLNCAACHTAELTYEGKRIRVDGGPTLANFQRFEDSLRQALRATADDKAKFERFADRVLGVKNNVDNRAMLRAELQRLVNHQLELARLNAISIEYGNARLDAVGHILNKIALVAQAPGQFGGPPDAPVSYPFIWNANQHDFVQWNGIAPNKGAKLPSGETFDIGALVRNTSEVIGVFADVTVAKKAKLKGYNSSVYAKNLDAMEALLGKLMSPPWPVEVVGSYNVQLAEKGKALFVEKKCASCHFPLARDDLKTPIKAVMSPIWGNGSVGTDPWMACNAFTYEAYTGRLNGVKKGYKFGKDRFTDRGFTREMLVATSVGTLFGKKGQVVGSAARAAFGLPRTIDVAVVGTPLPGQKSQDDRWRDCRDHAGDQLMRYKARPLNGIWATAPYLHNGSVKSLYELLLVPSMRDPEFWVGNREFDPIDVGYADKQNDRTTLFRVNDEHKKAIHGNSNAGHDYGNADFDEPTRRALVEYMKSL